MTATVKSEVNESVADSVLEVANSAILSLIAKKADKITVKQIADLVASEPSVEHIDIDESTIVDLLGGNKNIVKIEPDPNNDGLMTIFFNMPTPERKTSDEQKDRDLAKIKKSAMNTIKKDLK